MVKAAAALLLVFAVGAALADIRGLAQIDHPWAYRFLVAAQAFVSVYTLAT